MSIFPVRSIYFCSSLLYFSVAFFARLNTALPQVY